MMKFLTPLLLLALTGCTTQQLTPPPLPSWNDSDSKQAIVSFVEDIVNPASSNFVPPAERLAVFDNDGTLWAEQPVYFQVIFAMDEIKRLAPEHPEWKTTEPFASVIEGDMEAVMAGGKEGLMTIIGATHGGITADQYQENVANWLESTRHPKTGLKYPESIYQPMLELLDYLRSNDIKTYIVSGGGIDFMRVFTEEAYGIPPEQVIGTQLQATYEEVDGVPSIVKQDELFHFDDKEGKPVGIHQHIGRRPTMAFGNSDGDFAMIEWTTSGEGPGFGAFVHHTDEEREWAYDRDSHIGQLVRGLDEAEERGFVIIDMKKDWETVFPKN